MSFDKYIILDKKIKEGNFKESNKIVKDIFEEKGPSILLLKKMILINENLNDYSKVLLHCNLILMYEPLDIYIHKIKIKALKKLRKLDILSDYLIELNDLGLELDNKIPNFNF